MNEKDRSQIIRTLAKAILLGVIGFWLKEFDAAGHTSAFGWFVVVVIFGFNNH